jgi:hypothetical protein
METDEQRRARLMPVWLKCIHSSVALSGLDPNRPQEEEIRLVDLTRTDEALRSWEQTLEDTVCVCKTKAGHDYANVWITLDPGRQCVFIHLDRYV